MTSNKAAAQQQLDEDVYTSQLESSPVGRLFDGRSVFITGASGFIGRVLLEKLLRTYKGIKRVYILMRVKKNMQPADRLHKQLLNVPIFDELKSMKDGQDLLDKIVVVPGDIGEPQLGISDENLGKLLSDKTLGIVFHSAATVKFDEPLQTSVKFNLAATKCMIEICKQIENLVCLCHVSTAYVNSDIKDGAAIEERLYPIRQQPGQVIKLAQLMDEEMMQAVRPRLVGERPNTYTYTKALGEHLIALEASQLPVAIVRPSIVVASWREPFAGWIDNLNGPTGLVLAIGKGLLRSMHVRRDAKADIIPVDIVVNTMIAAAFYAAKTNNKLAAPDEEQKEEAREGKKSPVEVLQTETVKRISNGLATEQPQAEQQKQQQQQQQQQLTCKQSTESTHTEAASQPQPFIVHCTSGDRNPIKWGNMEDMFFPIIRHYPSEQVLRYPFGSFKSNKYHDFVTRLFVHYLPALIIDLLCLVMGKKRQLMSIYFKLHSAVGALSHFTTTNYNFKTENVKKLEALLEDPRDKRELYLDIRPLDWYTFWDSYVLGARRHVLKEADSSLEVARQSFKRAYYLELCFRFALMTLAAYLLGPLVGRNLVSCGAALRNAFLSPAVGLV